MTSIVVGMSRGLLLKPYDERVPQDFIRKIREKIQGENIHYENLFGDVQEVVNSGILEEILSNEENMIELFGVWEDRAVLNTTQYAIKQGISVFIPKGLTLRHPEAQGGSIREDVDSIYKIPKTDPYEIAQTIQRVGRCVEQKGGILISSEKPTIEAYQ